MSETLPQIVLLLWWSTYHQRWNLTKMKVRQHAGEWKYAYRETVLVTGSLHSREGRIAVATNVKMLNCLDRQADKVYPHTTNHDRRAWLEIVEPGYLAICGESMSDGLRQFLIETYMSVNDATLDCFKEHLSCKQD